MSPCFSSTSRLARHAVVIVDRYPSAHRVPMIRMVLSGEKSKSSNPLAFVILSHSSLFDAIDAVDEAVWVDALNSFCHASSSSELSKSLVASTTLPSAYGLIFGNLLWALGVAS